ncbi:MAG TPA: hypothetical protein VFE78_38045, partial [Gemmataceae bacterium]|nr:hypothetical protein [Gemmataceae bacterium]
GATFPLAVSPSEDYLLQAFIANPAMRLGQPIDRSGVSGAAKVLARLVAKYGAAFAPAIRRPGARGARPRRLRRPLA